MKILIMDSRLTSIKRLCDAKGVLDSLRESKQELSFPTSDTTKAVFTPAAGSSDVIVWEPDSKLGVDPAFQPAIQMDEERAIRRLYELRKDYNRYWRD